MIRWLSALLLALVVLNALAASERHPLRAPLSTEVAGAGPLPATASAIVASVEVPAGAPSDLGIGAFVAGREGQWYQRLHPGPLGPGRHHLRFELDAGPPWSSEPDFRGWSPAERATCQRWGLFWYSARPVPGLRLHVPELAVETSSPAASAAGVPRLRDLEFAAELREGVQQWRSGERWWCRVRPEPYPADPYDPAAFALDLLVAGPGGERRIPGFHREPLRLVDRGDREAGLATGPAHFELRWRPARPGRYHLSLLVRAPSGERRIPLPPVVVSGPPRDQIVRTDSADPRFWATGDGDFYFPIGLNLSAVTDTRSVERYGTRATPERGSQAYAAYFARLAAHGANAAELWLSTWNLSLEWHAGRPHYHGLGRYNQLNAARLDRVLDTAWSHGLRLVLNLRNHGQLIRPTADESEWVYNPYNAANGGPCATSDRFFDDESAWNYQQRLRRYQVARYGDHPAVLTWKLMSEVDLTDAGIRTIRQGRHGVELLVDWHERATRAWHELDAYDHPVSTHFATDMHNVHPKIAATSVDAVLLDAYHRPGHRRWQPPTLAELMADSLYHQRLGCARYRKPVMVTEYGGALGDHSRGKLAMEHRTGMWAALVSGHSGAPMLWWYEWVDHDTRYAPYLALARFVAGEDLRGADASSIVLAARSERGPAWCRAWVRPGRLLGYAQDRGWASEWGEAPPVAGLRITVGGAVAAGPMHLEWWNADSGEVVERTVLEHPGGRLVLVAPPHAGHIAFKLVRSEE